MLTSSAALKLLLCAAPLKLATLGFSQVGMTDAQAGFFAEHFSVQLASVDDTIRVTTPKDMTDLLGAERQRTLLGCSETATSCMAELAGAVGADGLVTGQIAKVGKSYQLNLKVLAADGSKTMFVHSSKLLASEEELIGELNEIAPKAVARVRAALAPAGTAAAVTQTEGGGSSRPKLRLVPTAIGAALAGVGAIFLGISVGQLSQLNALPNSATLDEAQGLRSSGRSNVIIGSLLVSVGAVAMIAGLVWYLLA